MHAPSIDHRNAMDRILRSLKSAPDKGFMFAEYGHLNVTRYIPILIESDASLIEVLLRLFHLR